MKKFAITILCAYCFVMVFAGYKTILAIVHPLKYKEDIIEASTTYQLPPELVASLVNVESKYKPKAKSNKDAIGLCQIKLDTAKYLNNLYNIDVEIFEEDLYNPKTNLKYGCLYLKYLTTKFNDINTALAAYNAGETRVRTWLKSTQYSTDNITLKYIPYKETSNYVKKINNNLKYYKKYY